MYNVIHSYIYLVGILNVCRHGYIARWPFYIFKTQKLEHIICSYTYYYTYLSYNRTTVLLLKWMRCCCCFLTKLAHTSKYYRCRSIYCVLVYTKKPTNNNSNSKKYCYMGRLGERFQFRISNKPETYNVKTWNNFQ